MKPKIRRYYLPKNEAGITACEELRLAKYNNDFSNETLKIFMIGLHGNVNYYVDVKHEYLEFSKVKFSKGNIEKNAEGIVGLLRNIDLTNLGI